jgi:hypothetical protein
MPSFPQNEFWQCPSYTWSSTVLGVMITLVIMLSFMVDTKLGAVMSVVGGVVGILWALRVLYKWFVPDQRCNPVGFTPNHYGNPFYKDPLYTK